MKYNKIAVCCFVLLFTCLSSYTQIKVACVGNSITYGATIKDRQHYSYPAQLDSLLGEGWDVQNFGVSGSTLLKNGDRPYWKQKAFTDAKDFNPDVVIIKLGTNDTKPYNWTHKDEFIGDYTAMINEFKALPSKPYIFVCLPVPAYPDRWGISDSTITVGVIPMVKKVAKKNKVKLIDLHEPLGNHANWFPDKIHPNAEGAGEMAKVIKAELLKNKKKIEKRAN
jgi:lysophospholipase L1-like esterase